jgi:hypothetical protein
MPYLLMHHELEGENSTVINEILRSVKNLVLIFLDENSGQKCNYLELAKSKGGVFCISQSYLIQRARK